MFQPRPTKPNLVFLGMVKITIVGRVMDGLPLAQGPRYVNEENCSSFLCYKQQGEFILKEISRGALIPSKMTIRIDHHSLNYLIGNGLGKLQDHIVFVKFDGVIGSIRKQYIDTRTQANLSKLNANREKELEIVTENISEILQRKRNSEISERLPATTPEPASPIWGSPLLEVIALKWTPITAIVAVAAILLWASLVLKDDFII
ncbi:hypothetical protein OIU78_016384 [Salix suchowensis]|nr:hypothetical protein OIU78_016384 [Salix suchowensis]